ncbi:MAG: cyclic pyranopterin monophosphate synthase MoaC [Lysobacterales bacterium CG17_big_fil_post_rev_8_21_14_2_50_64_11]|nr:MAG: cyclic pyranopterin monophosphate synthase MoaC [Xanthomonadales bacterium CG17_big_fil_post_rev_8_21_14_2_50_64_11]PIX60130.1 MAG: cyclic pyranopterin monophosphate synthase MoaC [Xanthomonadales bacterium CG_4_10_14_3_um_filter_64_11]
MVTHKRDTFTHVDDSGQPAMVDVSGKAVSVREALAECRVRFPVAIAASLREQGMSTAKGPVIATAIIAGTQAVKQTSALIPFCHPLPIDACRIEAAWLGENILNLTCHVRTCHRTGVEMEALTGATLAALTVYDMCKALSHRIVLGPARLLAKSGGKQDFGKEKLR